MRVIAHRGASAIAPENTLVAFERAVADGADGIELDARLTADGVVVIMHDDDVATTTTGTGRISEMTFDEVRALDAAGRRGGWPGALRVPTLDEAIAAVAGRVPLTIELKGALHGGSFISAAPVARAIAPVVSSLERVVVSSFEPQATAAMREIAPGVRTAITSFHGVDPSWALALAIEVGHAECHVPRADVSEDFVERAHAAGIEVLCWTVDEPADVAEMVRMGVDGIFTDDPARARAAL